MASCNLKAIPGHEKVTSNNRAPPANEAIVKPEIVTIGNRALGNAWSVSYTHLRAHET